MGSDVTEMKNNLLVNPDDTYKLDHMEDKLTKLENTLKLETGLLKSGVIDLDTDNDALKHETSKLMNEIQSSCMQWQTKIPDKNLESRTEKNLAND